MVRQDNRDIRVLIVDHSALSRVMITDTLESDPRIKVVDVSRDGLDIIEKIKLHKPDVVTVDAEIPDKGGLECLKKIMTSSPLPVIMFSNLNERYESLKYEALSLGASDFISKPDNLLSLKNDLVKKDLIKKVHIAKSLKYNHSENVYHLPHHLDYNTQLNQKKFNHCLYNDKIKIKNIVAIGTSTGGPRALQSVIPFIPKDLPASYLIVQHMPPGFTKSLADRLNNLSDITVKEAEDNDILKAGVAYIAPGGYHMLVNRNRLSGELTIKLSDMPPVNRLRPSANVLFNSLAETDLDNLIGVIMTGMGYDGCEGLINMKQRNKAHIIAESEESCVIFGMPKAVINAGIADKVIPVAEITNEILNYVGVHRNGYESIH